ncbi:hypothetical protein Vretifemale_8890, partial [Volvox reticuliferus]
QLMAIERDRRISAAAAATGRSTSAALAAGALLGDSKDDTTEGDSKKNGRGQGGTPARTPVGAAAGRADDGAATNVVFHDGSTRVVMVTSLTHRAGPLQWHDKQS